MVASAAARWDLARIFRTRRPLMSEPEPAAPSSAVEIVRSASPGLLRELGLVLQAVEIPYEQLQGPGYFSLFVPRAFAQRALEEIERYGRENRNWPPRRARVVERFRGGTTGVLLYAVAMMLVFRFAAVDAFGLDWMAAGAADGERIAGGELWRALTALSLHSDFVHLASNLVFGAAVGLLLSPVYGPGLAWLLFLASGFAGNLANSWANGFAHLSVGASTAVFGGLGALAATQSVQKLRLGQGVLARIAPLIAAAVLLGWYGVGSARIEYGRGLVQDPGDRTDVGAHLFGFAAGIALGALAALWQARGGGGPTARKVAAALAVAALPLGWVLAFAIG